jgi:hypothetical protein
MVDSPPPSLAHDAPDAEGGGEADGHDHGYDQRGGRRLSAAEVAARTGGG